MNIFRNRAGLLGEFDTGNSSCSLQNIFELVSEIKIKLSSQSYLLDNYLSAVLQAANITLAHNAADEGFLAGSTLHRLCTAALNNIETDDHPLYETVKLDFEKHHLKYQERQTQHCLHYISLADDFLKSIVPTFLGEQDSNRYDPSLQLI